MVEEKPKAIDLFAGAGGLSKGISEAGFEVIYALDANDACKETYDRNHEAEMQVADIRKVEPSKLDIDKEKITLVAGGPPCPTFSKVGKSKINSIENRNNREDDRHLLYEEFLKFVQHFEPKAFIMENVKGMTSEESAAGNPVVDVIKSQMEDLGYTVDYYVLDAADYGVPQNRERLFFIGNRISDENPDPRERKTHTKPNSSGESDIKFRHRETTDPNQTTIPGLSESTESSFPNFRKNQDRKPWNTVADAITDLPPLSPEGDCPPKKVSRYTVPAISKYQVWARNFSEDQDRDEMVLYNHECRGHNLYDLSLYKLLGEGVGYKIGQLPEEIQPYREDIFNDKIKKQHPRKPASTVVAHLAKDGHMFVHPTEARSISPREAARLQSFKDDFVFPVSRTNTFKQIGNAVPPLLGQAVATSVKEFVEKES